MKEDIIFHITPVQQWQEAQEGGIYRPESLDKQGYIACSTGNELSSFINTRFEGESKLMMIVIDCSTAQPKISFQMTDLYDKEIPCIQGPLNLDAVLDRITLKPDEEGHFEIDFQSDE